MTIDYRDYIESPEWFEKAEALKCFRGWCQSCLQRTYLEVHHVHYRTLGNESPRDLVVLCAGCHARAHRDELRVVDLAAANPATWDEVRAAPLARLPRLAPLSRGLPRVRPMRGRD